MESFLSDLDAWMWRYRDAGSNYAGVHFTARPSACRGLLRARDVMTKWPGPTQRQIPLKRLEKKNLRRVAAGDWYPHHDFDLLKLRLQPASESLQQMHLRTANREVELTFTELFVGELSEGLESVAQDGGDFSVAPCQDLGPLGALDRASLELWFWPCFEP